MIVNFRSTLEDATLIRQIVKRVIVRERLGGTMQALEMDLTAAHLNGCPLDLAKLLAFGDGDFYHDIAGIQRHINRETGALEDCFLPRCAKPEVADG